MSAAVDWAEKYIRDLGLALVPIPPGSKGPRGHGWNQPGNYFTDPAKAREFWSGRPDFGMGAVLGPSRIVTWDVDNPPFTRLLLEDLGYDYDTLVEGAPRLQGNPERDKYLFRAPVGVSLSRHSLAWPGKDGGKPVTVFELRAGDVQDVLPPSIHPDQKRPYQWVNPPQGGFPEIPPLLLRLWLHWSDSVESLKAACPWATMEATKPKRPARELKEPQGESVIEAFNRAHSLVEILEAHGYKPKGKRRLLSPNSTTGLAGMVLLDGGATVYSHHSADPLADGHAHDAFDAYRILEHGGGWKEATKAAAKALGMESKRKATVHSIGGGQEIPGEESAGSVGDWHDRLGRSARGTVYGDLANIVLILSHHEAWKGVLAFDEHRFQVTKRRPPPYHNGKAGEWQDTDDTRTAIWLTDHFGMRPGPGVVAESVKVVADDDSTHPVREYLRSLKWDGQPRVVTWLPRLMGTDDTPYTRLVGSCWLIAAVARVMHPGCKVDNVLILEGNQGIGKSSALRDLAGEDWFSDTPFEIGSREAYMAIKGKWLVELAELDAFSRAESSKAKAFFAAQSDTYRPPWGRNAIDVKRQCVFAGTVNLDEYLRDETGNRRYWPVRCNRIEHAALRDQRDQLWAEALHLYESGEEWWIRDQLDYVQAEQDARYAADVWEQKLRVWIHQRAKEVPPTGDPLAVTIQEALEECLEIPAGKWSRADQMRVSGIFKRIGLIRRRLSVEGRPWGYCLR